MKMVTAVFQVPRLEEVRTALEAVGIQGMTVTEVRGFGRQKGHKEIYRGQEYTVSFAPKAKLEVAVSEHQVDQVVKTICEHARTGNIGDGKIFVTSLEQVVRIRTGEQDEEAL